MIETGFVYQTLETPSCICPLEVSWTRRVRVNTKEFIVKRPCVSHSLCSAATLPYTPALLPSPLFRPVLVPGWTVSAPWTAVRTNGDDACVPSASPGRRQGLSRQPGKQGSLVLNRGGAVLGVSAHSWNGLPYETLKPTDFGVDHRERQHHGHTSGCRLGTLRCECFLAGVGLYLTFLCSRPQDYHPQQTRQMALIGWLF